MRNDENKSKLIVFVHDNRRTFFNVSVCYFSSKLYDELPQIALFSHSFETLWPKSFLPVIHVVI